MEKIVYQVELLKQGIKECVQTSAAEFLHFYGIQKTVEEIKKEVPVSYNEKSEPLGSSIGHLGTYLLQQGLSVKLHVAEIEVFDMTWEGLSSGELIQQLEKRKEFLTHSRYPKEALRVVIEGCQLFLKNGGKIVFPIFDEKYLYQELQKGPFLAVVSYQFLNRSAKTKQDALSKDTVNDPIAGIPSTHMVVVSGFKEGKFQITDPDFVYGGKRWIASAHLLGAMYLAESDFDSMIMTVEGK